MLRQVADHTADVIGALDRKPAVMGHSTGGLLAQLVADRGLSAATVAIDPGPFRGVLPLPLSSLRAALPVLKNPLNRGRAGIAGIGGRLLRAVLPRPESAGAVAPLSAMSGCASVGRDARRPLLVAGSPIRASVSRR